MISDLSVECLRCLSSLTGTPRNGTSSLGRRIDTVEFFRINAFNTVVEINKKRRNELDACVLEPTDEKRIAVQQKTYLVNLCFFMYLAAQFPHGRLPSHFVLRARHRSQLAQRVIVFFSSFSSALSESFTGLQTEASFGEEVSPLIVSDLEMFSLANEFDRSGLR